MANTPSVDEAVAAAQRAQDVKIEAVRTLARTRQAVTDERTAGAERIAEVKRDNARRIVDKEKDDIRAYRAALRLGWTRRELAGIGFPEPEKLKRARRKQSRAKSTAAGDTAAAPAATTAIDDGTVVDEGKNVVPEESVRGPLPLAPESR